VNDWKNKLYYGDNLIWLRDHDRFPNESVDLIYLDPPFNSKSDYNVIFTENGGEKKSQAQIKAFDDTWHWEKEASEIALQELSMKAPAIAEFISWLGKRGDKNSTSTAAYLSMMATRLIELHRVLKPTGSLYLHCDPTASHYLKIVLDLIFKPANFRNEIIWKRKTGRGETTHKSNRFGISTDILLFYTKNNNNTFHSQFNFEAEGYEAYITKFYRFSDGNGRIYRIADLSSPSPRPNLMYEYKGFKPPKNGWAISYEKMEQWDKEDRLIFPKNKNGRIQRKRYLDELKGKPVQNLWDDIDMISSQSKERLGYPTQKPIPLLERIIQASSNEGDIVLDPFCGCGTTIAAAQMLNRKWIGIDVTWLAIDLIEKRLVEAFGKQIKTTYEIKGHPTDEASAEALAKKNKKEFEVWAITLVGAASREYDGGVDGIFGFTEKDRKFRKIVVQVKGGDILNPGMVRDLIGTVKKEDAAIGLLITLRKPTSGMLEAAVHNEPYYSELWNKNFPSIQIRTIDELLNGKDFDLPPTDNPMKKATRIKGQIDTERML